ncbi:MAG: HAD family hydrolase [Coriobacteriales bacterium]
MEASRPLRPVASAVAGRGGLDRLVAERASNLACVFCDMDGTLLTPLSRLPDGLAEAVRRLQSTGVRFVPATGRTLWSIRDILSPLGNLGSELDLVAGNGMDVIMGGRSLVHLEYDRTLLRELLDAVRSDPARPGMVVYDQAQPYLLNMSAETFFSGRQPTNEASLFAEADDLPRETVVKAALIAREDPERVAARYADRFAGRLEFAVCGRHWIDIPLPGAGKDAGALALLRGLGVGPERAIAFGDSMNDAALMGIVGGSVAVSNALPQLKGMCSYEIGSNAEGAVVQALEALADARLRG